VLPPNRKSQALSTRIDTAHPTSWHSPLSSCLQGHLELFLCYQAVVAPTSDEVVCHFETNENKGNVAQVGDEASSHPPFGPALRVACECEVVSVNPHM